MGFIDRSALTRAFTLALIAVTVISGCANSTTSVTGSGTMSDETRELADFSRIELRTMGQVTVTLGEPAGVQLRVEDNLMPLVETNVRDGWLVIESPPNTTLSPTLTIEINVTMPELAEIKLSGAGNVIIDVSGTLNATVSGMGNILYSGDPSVTQNVTGSGSVRPR
jgi:hypothetical protein